MVLKPNFQLIHNGVDITGAIRDHLRSIELKDEVGFKNDELTIKTTKPYIPPIFNDNYSVSLGYSELTHYGAFSVQTIEEEQFGYIIKATGVNYSEGLKKKKNKSFENVSLPELVEKIAASHGLSSKCDYDEIFFIHVSQTFESDIAFLQRLAEKHNATFNLKNGKFIFLKQKQSLDTYSQTLPIFQFETTEITNLKIKNLAKTHYKSCAAHYWDTREDQQRIIIEGTGEPQFILPGSFTTPSEAKRAAYNKLLSLHKNTRQGSFNSTGQECFAGGRLQLITSSGSQEEFLIKSVNHTLNENGWNTKIDFHN